MSSATTYSSGLPAERHCCNRLYKWKIKKKNKTEVKSIYLNEMGQPRADLSVIEDGRSESLRMATLRGTG